MISQVIGALALIAATDPTPAPMASPWKVDSNRISVPAAKVSLPRQAGSLIFESADEFSHKGSGIDNVAQYESSDHRVYGTVFIYRPGYPDAALTAWETDSVLHQGYGAAMKTISTGVADSNGHPGTVIRMLYDGGSNPRADGGAILASAAGILRVSGWIVKLRVNGPTARQAEVVAALDALIAGLRFDSGVKVYPATPLRIAAPCPAADVPARLLPQLKGNKDSSARVLGAAISSAAATLDATEKDKANGLDPNFPDNGLQPVCLRGTFDLNGASVPLFQLAGTTDPGMVIGIMSNAGSTIQIEKAFVGGGYVIKTAKLGEVDIFGAFDAIPSTSQLGALYSGNAREGGTRQARIVLKAAGGSDIEIDPDVLK